MEYGDKKTLEKNIYNKGSIIRQLLGQVAAEAADAKASLHPNSTSHETIGGSDCAHYVIAARAPIFVVSDFAMFGFECRKYVDNICRDRCEKECQACQAFGFNQIGIVDNCP